MTSMPHIRHNKFIKNEVCITTARHFIHFLDLNSSMAYSKKKMEKNDTVRFIPTRFVITIFQLHKAKYHYQFLDKISKEMYDSIFISRAGLTNLKIK